MIRFDGLPPCGWVMEATFSQPYSSRTANPASTFWWVFNPDHRLRMTSRRGWYRLVLTCFTLELGLGSGQPGNGLPPSCTARAWNRGYGARGTPLLLSCRILAGLSGKRLNYLFSAALKIIHY